MPPFDDDGFLRDRLPGTASFFFSFGRAAGDPSRETFEPSPPAEPKAAGVSPGTIGFSPPAPSLAAAHPSAAPSLVIDTPSLRPRTGDTFASLNAPVGAALAAPPAASSSSLPAPTAAFDLIFLGLPLPRFTVVPDPFPPLDEADPLPFAEVLRPPAVPLEDPAAWLAAVRVARRTRPERSTSSCISSMASLTLGVLGGQEGALASAASPSLLAPCCPSKAAHLAR